jgi:hypothetical protein
MIFLFYSNKLYFFVLTGTISIGAGGLSGLPDSFLTWPILYWSCLSQRVREAVEIILSSISRLNIHLCSDLFTRPPVSRVTLRGLTQVCRRVPHVVAFSSAR